MSDDFAVCNNCGTFDARFTTIEELKEDILNSVYTYFKNNDDIKSCINFLQEMIVEYEELNNLSEHYEGKCHECDQWSTLMWQHIEYVKDE